MYLRVIVLLAVVGGAVWYFKLLPSSWQAGLSQAGRSAGTVASEVLPSTAPPPMYKWTDANGRVVYGAEPPAGHKAERVSGGTVSVVEATKVAPPKASGPQDLQSLRDQAIERAVHGVKP